MTDAVYPASIETRYWRLAGLAMVVTCSCETLSWALPNGSGSCTEIAVEDLEEACPGKRLADPLRLSPTATDRHRSCLPRVERGLGTEPARKTRCWTKAENHEEGAGGGGGGGMMEITRRRNWSGSRKPLVSQNRRAGREETSSTLEDEGGHYEGGTEEDGVA